MVPKLTRESLYIALASLALYLACASGWPDTIDCHPSYRTAQALVEHGSFGYDNSDDDPMLINIGKDNKAYSRMGLLMPILYVPAVLMEKTVNHFYHFKPEVLGMFFVSLCNSFVAAFIVGLVYLFFRKRGLSFKVALVIALTTGFATVLFPFAKSSSREPVQALCLFGTFVAILRSREEDDPFRGLAAASIWVSLGLLAKQAFIIPLLPTVLLVPWKRALGARHWRRWALVLIAPICSAIVYAYFASHAYGGVLKTGYSPSTMSFQDGPWVFPFWNGIHVQLFSSKNGILLFNPVLLVPLFVLVWKTIHRRISVLDIAILASFLLQTAFYARWAFPLGGDSVGPRYLSIFMPLFSLILLDSPFETGWVKLPVFVRGLTGVLVLFSFLIQVINISVRSQEFHTFRLRARNQYEPRFRVSHVRANFVFIKDKLTKGDEKYNLTEFGSSLDRVVDMSDLRSMKGFDFWWYHLYQLKQANSLLEAVSPNS